MGINDIDSLKNGDIEAQQESAKEKLAERSESGTPDTPIDNVAESDAGKADDVDGSQDDGSDV